MPMLPAEIVGLIQRAPCVPRRNQQANLGAGDACARVDAIADGLRTPGLKDQLLELEKRQSELQELIAQAPSPTPRLSKPLGGYQTTVSNLPAALNDPARRLHRAARATSAG
jgi:hypothetical protein